MKKRILFVILAAAMSLCMLVMPACGGSDSGSGSDPITVEITRDGYEVSELNAMIGDEIELSVRISDGSAPSVSWVSSKPAVATVNGSGKVEVKGEGTAIITVIAGDATDSIFINAKQKVEQTGVGSGKSSDDPIFKGNEGKDEPLEVYFIEMTQMYEDSIFIKKGNVEVLIDAGEEPDGKLINTFLKEKVSDNRLDLLMASHSDSDHIYGISAALDGVENISMMIDYGGVGSGTVKATREKYIPKGMEYHSAYDCVNFENEAVDRYYLTSELYVDILDTGEYIRNDEGNASNPHSLATIFSYKSFKFFTAGDLTTDSEAKLMKNENLPEVTLYKASHHGSAGSNSQALLNTINPKAVAISAARSSGTYQEVWEGPSQFKTNNLNGYGGHPHQDAIERIYKAPNISVNLNVYWNMVNGTMKFITYGEDGFTFQGSATQKGYYDLTSTGGKGVWNAELNDFENKVTGEENFRLHESKVFEFRGYQQYLPAWAKQEYFPDAA